MDDKQIKVQCLNLASQAISMKQGSTEEILSLAQKLFDWIKAA